MPTIAQYLEQLTEEREALKTNLNNKGVTEAVDGMTFTELVPLVNNISSGIDTSDATATADDILADSTAYVNGQKITGTIESISATTYIPSTEDAIIESGKYLSGNQTIKGDANLVPENIKSGVEIFGINGTASASGTDTSDATATAADILTGQTAYIASGKVEGTIPLAEGNTITPTIQNQVAIQEKTYATGDIVVAGDENLLAENIKSGVEIFGVTGTFNGSTSTMEYVLLDTNTSAAAIDTVANWGTSVFISEDSGATFTDLATVVSNYGGITSQNNFIGTAEQKYGINMSNWTTIPTGSNGTSILFLTPITLAGSSLILSLNAYESGWMNNTLVISLVSATGDTQEEVLSNISSKIEAEDFILSRTLVYPGSLSLSDFYTEGKLPIRTLENCYLYISGTVKQDNSSFTYNKVRIIDF